MTIQIEYQPAALSYDEFHQIDLDCFPDEHVDIARFQEFLAQDFWAAWEGEALAGYCSAYQISSLAWIRRVGVAGSHRRRGAGRQLMQAAIEHYSKMEQGEIMLYVLQDNLPALRLYEDFGFEVADMTYQYIWKSPGQDDRIPTETESSVSILPISEVPEAKMPELPLQWMDLRERHAPPNQYALIFFNEKGETIGYCRLAPGFPGCFPFALNQPETNLPGILNGLRKYLLPEKDHLKLTFNDEAIAKACDVNGIQLNCMLFKMVRPIS
jgi:GNAT superfamily N-acetyltransferase